MVIPVFSNEAVGHMRDFFQSLNEKDRRRCAGLEASKLGHGGINYISEILGCDPKTVRRGMEEVLHPPNLEPGRIRQKGGPEKLS